MLTDVPARIRYAAVAAAVAFASCSGGNDAEPASTTVPATTVLARVSEDEAIAIARATIEADIPEFDFTSRHPVVRPLEGNYDVSFPLRDVTAHAGEPHVVIDPETGEVLEAYETA